MSGRTKRERVHEIEYSTEGRTELAERIVALEDACTRALRCIRHGDCDACAEMSAGCALRTSMTDLGLEA